MIDIDHNTRVGSIIDTPGVHGVAIAHQLGRAYVSDGQTAQASIVELNTLATIAHVTTGDGPDSVVYEPSRNEVYPQWPGAFGDRVRSRNGNVVATIALPVGPSLRWLTPPRAASTTTSKTRT